MKRLLAVKASAGSGKTFRLANRYISLLNTDNPVNIIAITFTNKAANEMKERIVKFLSSLGDDGNVVNMICNELNITENELLKRKDLLLKKFLTNNVNIQTIDSFINKILRKFSYFAGFRSNFEIGGDERDIIFRDFLINLTEKEFMDLINIAKTEEKFQKSLTELFENLYEKDKELQNITLTPVKKPNDENTKNAFLRLKDYILNSPEASKSAIKAVNIDFYDIPNTTWFCKENMKDYSYFKKKSLYQEWFEDVLFELKSFFKDYFRYKEYVFFNNLFKFYNKYKNEKIKYKKATNRLDFKDIEHLVYDLLKGIDKEFLYFRLDSRINHVLMDEFQDTSTTQWEIFEPLVEEIASGIGRSEFRSFFYVGDTKQAIYRFRGGQKELFEVVANKYKPFGLEVEELSMNFRSAKNIVEFVNEKFGLKEKPNRDDDGYVEVDEIDKEDKFEKLYEKIKFLNENGVNDNDIAILVRKNDDILNVAEFLKEKGKKVVTAKKAEVISQKSAKAIISLMKYLNNSKLKIEKLNFLTLIGKKYSDEEIDIPIKRPVLMIKEIMDKFNLTDDASLKLLYHSKKYDTLVDFVDEIDNYSEELPLKEFDGIVVMTIHKSKGLEFDNVIVMDNLGDRESDNSGNIIFFYEDAKLKNLFLKTAGREIVDSDYKLVLKNEEKLKKEDKLSLEYVAFTRAKNSLIILKRKDKKFFETSLDIERRGSVIPSSKKEEEKLERVDLELKNFGSQEVEVKEEEYKPNDYEAIFKGEAIHYAFECNDIEAVRNLYGDFCEIEEVKRLYETAIKELPKGKKEVPLIVNKEVKRIDLLTDDKIIDYKLTKPHDEKNYIKQVEGYIEAVEIITNKKLKGYLFYVDSAKFREV